jgi:hypothetical protein
VKVLFLSPHYPEEMQDFTRGLAEVGAQVYGLSDAEPGALPARVRRHLSGYVQSRDLRNVEAVVHDIRAAFGPVSFDRVECMWEPHVILGATLRKVLGVPGMDVDTAIGFRDKSIMKERLLARGLRVPRYARVTTEAQARDAAAEIGLPLVIKPTAGAGTADTHGVSSAAELDQVLARVAHVLARPGGELSVEEYIEGDEFTYDAVAIAGKPVFESVAQYHPKPLESRNLEWISPAQIVLRDPYRPELMPGIELGRKVLEALGMGTGFVHMEWFRKPGGEAVFGEIAARNGGAKLVDQMNFANDFDVYREWARATCWHAFDDQPRRRYHAAVVFKRALGQGRIARIDGLDALRAFCGPGLVLEHLLPIGHPRRDWKSTLLSDGYVLVRDPDYERALDMMRFAINRLTLYAARG